MLITEKNLFTVPAALAEEKSSKIEHKPFAEITN